MFTQMHTNKYIEHLNQQQQVWGTDKCENAHIQAVAIEVSIRPDH